MKLSMLHETWVSPTQFHARSGQGTQRTSAVNRYEDTAIDEPPKSKKKAKKKSASRR